MRLITNNPRKIKGLEGYGLSVVERVPLEICPTKDNIPYLKTKREKLGHILETYEGRHDTRGKLDAKGFRFAIVVSRFNSFITDRLLEGALDALKRHGADDALSRSSVYRARSRYRLLRSSSPKRKDIDAVICLGAVIKGGTPHFHYVASEVTKGIAQASLESEKPISFGILTTESVEQAVERAGTKAGNKGYDAAMSVIEMVNLIKENNLCGEGKQEN